MSLTWFLLKITFYGFGMDLVLKGESLEYLLFSIR